jgi:hypothetical protein
MEDVFSIMTGWPKRNRYATDQPSLFNDLPCPLRVRRTFVRGRMSGLYWRTAAPSRVPEGHDLQSRWGADDAVVDEKSYAA